MTAIFFRTTAPSSCVPAIRNAALAVVLLGGLLTVASIGQTADTAPPAECAGDPEAQSNQSDQRIQLYKLDEEGKPQPDRMAAPHDLSITEMAEHIAIISQRPTIEHVRQLFALLPHSVRYEVREGKIVCPYSMILMTLSLWTPIDGSKVFEFDRLVRSSRRHFVLLNAHGMPVLGFSRMWLRSLDGMAKDVSYCEEWFSLRKDSLVEDLLFEWVVEGGYARGGPNIPGVRVPPRLEQRIHGIIIFDPARDACRPPGPPEHTFRR